MMLTFFLKLFTGIYHKLFETDLSNFQNSYFQDISESVILSYNLILLFLLIQIFFTALYMEPTYTHWFLHLLRNLEI